MFHWCTISLVVAGLLWYLLRRVVRQVTSNEEYILYIDEFAGNLFTGAFVMELGVIASANGFYSVPHFAATFVMLYIRNVYFTYESVCGFVDTYYNNGRKLTLSLYFIGITIFFQIAGMVLGQYLAKFFWAFEAFDSVTHTHELHMACRTAMSLSHPVPFVAFVELLGTLTMCLGAYFVPSKFAPFVVTTVAMINFYFFAHISGSFYNQSLATAFTFHCEGQRSDLEFFIIYWLAPTLGQIVAWETLITGKNLLQGGKEKSEKVE